MIQSPRKNRRMGANEMKPQIVMVNTGQSPMWTGFLMGWTRAENRLHAIVQNDNGHVREVDVLYIRIVNKPDIEFRTSDSGWQTGYFIKWFERMVNGITLNFALIRCLDGLVIERLSDNVRFLKDSFLTNAFDEDCHDAFYNSPDEKKESNKRERPFKTTYFPPDR